MPTTQQIRDYWVEPAVIGAGLGAGSAWMWGAGTAVAIGGSDYKLWMVMAGLGAVSVIAMNAIDNTINAHLPEDASIVTHPVETAVNVASTTGLLLAAEAIAVPGLASETLVPMVGVAAASIIGGRMVSDYLMGMPWIQSWGSSSGY